MLATSVPVDFKLYVRIKINALSPHSLQHHLNHLKTDEWNKLRLFSGCHFLCMIRLNGLHTLQTWKFTCKLNAAHESDRIMIKKKLLRLQQKHKLIAKVKFPNLCLKFYHCWRNLINNFFNFCHICKSTLKKINYFDEKTQLMHFQIFLIIF